VELNCQNNIVILISLLINLVETGSEATDTSVSKLILGN